MATKRLVGMAPLFGLVLVCICALWVLGIPIAGAQGSVKVTIQSMIDAAPDGGTVTVTAGSYTEALTVTKNLTLTGEPSSAVTITAPAGQRVITVLNNKDLRLVNLRLTGGNPGSAEGGALKTGSGKLTIFICTFVSNTASYGGAIFQDGFSGTVGIYGSLLQLNHATFNGGALFIRGQAVISATGIYSNTAGQHGGAIHFEGNLLEMYSGQVRNNTAGLNGGGLNANNSVSLNGTQFISNSAGTDGGALLQWNAGMTVTISGARFERNASAEDGGGVLVAHGATTLITSTQFISNTAKRLGGGLGVINGSLTVVSSTFSGNRVNSGNSNIATGGGLAVTGTVSINNSLFYSNSTNCSGCPYHQGGGVFAALLQPGSISNTTFEQNEAWDGGGLLSNGAPLVLVNDTFRYNGAAGATGYGGAVDAANSLLMVQDCSLIGNRVVNEGGAFQVGKVLISHSLFISNSAGYSGGAIRSVGTLNMDRSQVVNNRAGSFSEGGGAIKAQRDLHITNTLFVSNSNAIGIGGDVALVPPSDMSQESSIVLCTFADPSRVTGSAIHQVTGTLRITDAIIASHAVGINQTAGALYVAYSLFYDNGADINDSGFVSISHSFGANPGFVNPGGGDYRLAYGSPAVDAGIDLGIVEDLDGHRRPIGAGFDIGAYERLLHIVLPMVLKN
jgi:predicted outer membrane repeat protein